jgi:mono/diheme cytochrome c family protein
MHTMIHPPENLCRIFGPLIFGLLPIRGVLEAADEPSFAADNNHIADITQTFFAEHCLRCHGPSKSEGNLRLDQLDSDLSNPAALERWLKIAVRLQSGEMPPQSEPRPQPEKLSSLLSTLTAQLDIASGRQRRAGRVVLRRLNRVEYENTLNDLFNVNVSVKDMLPEDALAEGFDNVGAALNISPVFIERCLDAIDAALDAAIAPVHQIESSQQRFDLYDSLPAWFLAGVWKQPEGVILFRTSGNSATDLRKFRAPAAGRYRFRIAASAHNSATPLPMAVLLGNFVVSGNPTRHIGYFDAPPGEPRVIDFEERLLQKNDTIKVTPVALPFVHLKHETMPEYPGPGLHIHWMEVEGPFAEEWPSESYRRVFGAVDPKTATLADAEKLLRNFLPKAFRRPVIDGEERPFVELVAESLESGTSFDAALRLGLKAVLTSPKFLYFRESTTPADDGTLDDYALASRLSYFLWSSMPDETLFELAGRDELHRPEVLRAQVERMLQHPKARAFTENFTGQWLSLREINATTPDKTLYPEFEELLQWSSLRETHLFFNELLREDLSVRNFADSDFAMLNGRLAEHYGIPDVTGVDFRRVPLRPEYHRGGVLTQASVLKVTANGSTTSPVLRGVWVLDRILGQPVPPPPPNVPAVEPDIRGANTIREQLAKHRSTENCRSCHARIDPPGFALENYDVIGGWRSNYRVVAERKNWVNNRVGPLAKYLAAWQYGLGPAIEAADVLPDGRSFADISEFKKLLLSNPEQIARCFTEKLLTYATGQPPGLNDRRVVDQILVDTQASDYGVRSLVHAVIASDLFRRK